MKTGERGREKRRARGRRKKGREGDGGLFIGRKEVEEKGDEKGEKKSRQAGRTILALRPKNSGVRKGKRSGCAEEETKTTKTTSTLMSQRRKFRLAERKEGGGVETQREVEEDRILRRVLLPLISSRKGGFFYVSLFAR